MTAPSSSIPDLPTVRTMQDVVDVIRIMKEHWALTNDFCDEVGGLTLGHTDKVLGPTEAKRLGYDTFALFLELCAIELKPQINMDAVKRMEAVWEKRERPLYPDAKVKRISKKLIQRAKPHVFEETGRLGGLVTAHLRTPAQRSESASKAAKSRWKKHRKTGGALIRKRTLPRSADVKSQAIAQTDRCPPVGDQAAL